MQKKSSLLLLFAVMIGFFVTAPTQAVTISFNVLDPYIVTGESFEVNVFAQEDVTAGDLYLFGFDVGSSSLWSYDGYLVDPAFWDEGYNSDNTLSFNYVAGSTFDPNAGNNILLATLSFTAGATTGTDDLSIEGILDGWDHGAYYDNIDAHISGTTDIITVHDAPIPEPGTMILFGLGLLGLAGVSRKK